MESTQSRQRLLSEAVVVSQEAIAETAGIVNSINGGLRVVCSGYSTHSEQKPQYPGATRFMVMVSGGTYPHRDSLKQLGLRWDPAEKAWRGTVDRNRLKQVEGLDNVRLCVIPRNDTETTGVSKSNKAPISTKKSSKICLKI